MLSSSTLQIILNKKYIITSPDLIPEENRAGNHVLALLKPHSVENGGPLIIKQFEFVKGRGNLVVEYPATEVSASSCSEHVVSFVGSHLDVVPADPSKWTHDPFKLTIDGDILHGRGTTDCLGHVALLTGKLHLYFRSSPYLLHHSIFLLHLYMILLMIQNDL